MMADDTRASNRDSKLVPVFIDRQLAPKGAIKLTENEVMKMQYKRLTRAKTSEKTAFQFGSHILGSTTAITACIVNNHFRTKFLLFNYGLMLSYAPTVCIPTIVTTVVNAYMSKKVLLQPECMGCLEVRSGILQVACSVLYSCLIAPFSSIALSKQYYTYLTRNNFQPGVKHALKTTPYHRWCFLALIVHNFGVGVAVRYKQGKQLENILANEPVGVTKQLLENITDSI